MTVSARFETIFLYDFNLGEKVANLFERRRQLFYHMLTLTEITGLSGKLKHCPVVETRSCKALFIQNEAGTYQLAK